MDVSDKNNALLNVEEHATKINQAINDIIANGNMCNIIDWFADKSLVVHNEYTIDYDAILPLFRPCPLKSECPNRFSKGDIYRRLAIIDNLYGTNIVRMRQFGLADLTERIWQLCNDGNGNHSDYELICKAVNFVSMSSSNISSATSAQTNALLQAFTGGYGVTSYTPKKVSYPEAPSILSKYIYFLMQSYLPNNLGFPIYDTIVCKYAPRLAKLLQIPIIRGSLSNMPKYINLLSKIIQVLEKDNPYLWNQGNPIKTKFALLDYFLWHIGKSKNQSYSLLLTKQEYLQYITSGKMAIPKRIQNWASINI